MPERCPLEGHCEDLGKLKDKVFGNGQPGLLSDVRMIGERQTQLHDEMQAVKREQQETKTVVDQIRRVLYIGIGALGGMQVLLKLL